MHGFNPRLRLVGVLAAAVAVAAAVTGGCARDGRVDSAPRTAASVGGSGDVPSPARPSAAPAAGTGWAAPVDVRLPDEGGRSAGAETTDWTTNRDPAQAWLLDPCRPTAYPTDARRTSFRTVSRTGPELGDARQLAGYASAAEAAETVAGFRRVLAACRSGGRPADGNGWRWVSEDVPGLGDEGLVAASTVGGPGYSSTGDRVAVTRVGAAVFLAWSRGEYTTAEIDDGAATARQVAERFLRSVGR